MNTTRTDAATVNPFRAIAQRTVNADSRFIDLLSSMHGFTQTEAVKIFATYRKLRCIKLDAIGGSWSVKHGEFWDRDVCERALAHT